MMYGDDFAHPQAQKSYQLMDKTLANMSDPKYQSYKTNAKYSTMKAFLKSLKQNADQMDF